MVQLQVDEKYIRRRLDKLRKELGEYGFVIEDLYYDLTSDPRGDQSNNDRYASG